MMLKPDSRSPLTRLLVYGTLRLGECNYAKYMKGLQPLATLNLSGYIMADLGGVPAVVKFAQDEYSKISCQLFELPYDQLMEIDDLESHPDWYKRELVPVPQIMTRQGLVQVAGPSQAWIYLMGEGLLEQPGTMFIPSGVWSRFATGRPWKGSYLHKKYVTKENTGIVPLDDVNGHRFGVPWEAHTGSAYEIVKPPVLEIGPGVEENV